MGHLGLDSHCADYLFCSMGRGQGVCEYWRKREKGELVRLDDEAIKAMQSVLGIVMPGAEVYMIHNELAETVELGITVGLLVTTRMSIEQVEDYTDRDWGQVLSQLVAGVRKSAYKVSKPAPKITAEQLREIGIDRDDTEE